MNSYFLMLGQRLFPCAVITISVWICVGAWRPCKAQVSETVSDHDAVRDDGALDDLDALLDADLEQLSRTDVVVPVFGERVTTVARQESTVGHSPAAVYVITGEMIRRSGVRTIPDALRLAPGVQVAQIDANKWAISVRGFNDRFANKLLVQIDGRTVYTPLFAGVFWDVQDVLLEDVDRIEIIRGPGAAIWGANAVNGIINIITKRSTDTPGLFTEAGGGSERGFASARVGGQRDGFHWRVYGKWFERGAGFSPMGATADDWRMGRLGFRTDWDLNCTDTLTVQGDYYDGTAGENQFQPTAAPPFVVARPDDHRLAGGNGLIRFTRRLDEDSDWSVQSYYDRTERALAVSGFREDRDTVDVEFQHRFRSRQWHSIIWGGGYRNTRDRIRNSFNLRFTPPDRSIDLFSVFMQDEMTLWEDLLFFTAGCKFQWNDFTGFEAQPTARLLYTPSDRQSIWGAFSRAVRVPSRASDDIRAVMAPSPVPVFPTYPTLIGDRDLESEVLYAWEAGMRASPTDDFFWDLAVFYHHYDNLHTIGDPGLPGIDPVTGLFTLPIPLVDGNQADSYGFELASTWKIRSDWTLRGAYSFLRLNTSSGNDETDDPRNQFFLHSSWDLGANWEFDLMDRYTDSLLGQSVPAYFEMDARLAWRPTDNFELAVVGRNLLDRVHREFGDDTIAGVLGTEVRREVYGLMTCRY